MSEYRVFGPFKMFKKNGLVDKHAYKEFWESVELKYPRLPSAVGCYIFAIRAAKGSRLWYVGKTEKHSFRGETWTPHKLNLYNEALNFKKKGTALLFLNCSAHKERQIC